MIGTAIGNYVVQSKLGEGGMGAVYLAEHARLGKRVVVKVLLPELARSKDVVARFFNEAKAATDIKNEHIVDVLDFGELPDGTSYIVMEWLEGQSLADLVRGGPVPVARTLHIAQGMSQALGAAHARGIVHRDLKPDNVFLVSRSGDPDFVKVLDFGIAKLTSNAGDVHTRTGAVMGTPLYMSPEQINGVNVDHRTDIYAMGIIVYQMLTGSLPFETTTLTELLLAHATKTPPPLRQRDASIPAEVEAAVMRALEKDPARRFESVAAFADALSAPPAPYAPYSALAATVAPQSFAAAPAPAPAFSSSSSSSSSKAPIVAIVAVAGGAALLALAGLVAFLFLRGSSASTVSPPSTTAVMTTTAPPTTSATPAPTSYVDHWKLKTTTCPKGSVPTLVETTHDGTSITSRAKGFLDSVGTVKPSGEFVVHNKNGTCTGTGTPALVDETCGNGSFSCHMTYEPAD
ncbi:MAG TPA: serine/threonine-protein kinase [Polyangiaceae bacterium]|nr:serine/threonine-protein kinase [Polyangiaceae bacterium]